MLKNYFDENSYQKIKESDNLIYKALELVTTLFEHDVDRGGNPYILHLTYVYRHVSSIDEKVVALLHDILEDKEVSGNDLLELGFPKKIVDDVLILTRDIDDYETYITKLLEQASREALNVKAADLAHNIDISRIKNPKASDYHRIENIYIPSREKIINRLKEMEK